MMLTSPKLGEIITLIGYEESENHLRNLTKLIPLGNVRSWIKNPVFLTLKPMNVFKSIPPCCGSNISSKAMSGVHMQLWIQWDVTGTANGNAYLATKQKNI